MRLTAWCASGPNKQALQTGWSTAARGQDKEEVRNFQAEPQRQKPPAPSRYSPSRGLLWCLPETTVPSFSWWGSRLQKGFDSTCCHGSWPARASRFSVTGRGPRASAEREALPSRWRGQDRTGYLVRMWLQHSEVFWGLGIGGSASQAGLVIKNLPANAGDIRCTGTIPGSGRSPAGGHGNPLQQRSCLASPVDRGAWWTIVHGVTQSQTDMTEAT